MRSAAALAAAMPSGGMPAAVRAADTSNIPPVAEVLHGWLSDVACLSPRVAEKAGAILVEQDVETVDDLAWLAALPAFDACGISALVADKIRAALAGRNGPTVVAAADSFTTPISTRMSSKGCGARASYLSSPPVRKLFVSPEAGSTHYDGGATAAEPARSRLDAGASLEAAAAVTASTGGIEELPTPELQATAAMAATTLQAAARQCRARSGRRVTVAAAVRLQGAARRLLARQQLHCAVRAVVQLQAAARRRRWAGRRDELRGDAADGCRRFWLDVSDELKSFLACELEWAVAVVQAAVRLRQYGDAHGPLIPSNFWTTDDSTGEVELPHGLSTEQLEACEVYGTIEPFSADQLFALDLLPESPCYVYLRTPLLRQPRAHCVFCVLIAYYAPGDPNTCCEQPENRRFECGCTLHASLVTAVS